MPLIKKFNEFFESNLKPSNGIYVESLNINTKILVEKYFMSLGFPALHGIVIYYINLFWCLNLKFEYRYITSCRNT